MWSRSAVDLVIGHAPSMLPPQHVYYNDNALMRSTLTRDMRDALSNATSTLANSANEKMASMDIDMEEHLSALVDQIDSKGHQITVNAWLLLEELDKYSSTTTVNSNNKDPITYDYFNSSSISTGSGVGYDSNSWWEGMQTDVAIIKAWEEEAKKLSLIANAAFRNLKSDTTNIKETATQEALSTMYESADKMYQTIRMDLIEKERLHREKHSRNNLSHDGTWELGGINFDEDISSEMALDAITSIPLKTYKLRDDKKRDLGVGKDERRTRYHVGFINNDDGSAISFDPSTIFSYNIGAVSQLATSLDRILSNVTVSSSFFSHQSSLREKLAMMISQTKSQSQNEASFKSPSQLASEVAALETEAALTRISHLSQTLTSSTRVNLIHSRDTSRMKSHAMKSESLERVSVIEGDYVSARENLAENVGSYLDQLLIHFDVMDKIKTVWAATKREFLEINEAAKIEAHIVREEIQAESVVERENESVSLEHIKLVGKARMEEVIHVIETFFWHLAGSLRHVITPEGRQQFLFYVCSIGVLVFAVSTIKEMLALMCCCILRFLTAPRLVREYGNLKTQIRWFSKRTQARKQIVLPRKIRDRMDTIVKVASAASIKRYPLRSVLIHGKPGCGKSMAAIELAQSIPNLPYALMSGADVFPMGSQGPAELRRLLTWASTRRHGGIIIIDEAESALGSRAKTKSDKAGAEKLHKKDGTSLLSSGYSRDCLNVLLSMTGTFGNIMLILTTSNPSNLDEAVLDRMDEIIHLPLPSSKERNVLLRNQFSLKFKRLDASEPSPLFKFSLGRSATKACHADDFDVDSSIFDLSVKTHGLSGRELEKLMQGVLYMTFASVTGILDMTLWRKETEALTKAVTQKHLLKKYENAIKSEDSSITAPRDPHSDIFSFDMTSQDFETQECEPPLSQYENSQDTKGIRRHIWTIWRSRRHASFIWPLRLRRKERRIPSFIPSEGECPRTSSLTSCSI